MDYKTVQELMKLSQKVTKVKKEMENFIVESEVDGLVIVFNGNMECISVFHDDGSQRKVFGTIKEAINKGIKHINQETQKKMQEIENSYKHLLPKN